MPRKIPKPHVSTHSKPRIYSAAANSSSNQSITLAGNYANYTDVDLQYFQDVWANTLAGAVIDKKIEFVFTGGIKPTFELIDTQNKDDTKIQDELKTYDYILDELKDVDRDLHFQQFIIDAVTMAKVFGRAVIAWDDVKGIPEQLKIVHPRDLGQPLIADQEDWSLQGVQAFQSKETITYDRMIYVCNKPNSPIRRSLYYGYSELQRVVGAARAMQRVLEFDAPEIAQSMWASYGLVIVNTDGKTEADATTQLNTIASGMLPGAFNFISGKPREDVEYIPMDLNAKIADIVQLATTYERMIIGNSAVPGPLLGREEDSNMATLFGKIRLFVAGPVQSDRDWISNIVSEQWYERNLIALGHGDVLSNVRIKAEFEAITIESWVDAVQAAQTLKNALPGFPDSAILTLLHLEQFKDEMEQNKAEREAKQQEIFQQQQQTQQEQAANSPQAQLDKKKAEVMDMIKQRVQASVSLQ